MTSREGLGRVRPGWVAARLVAGAAGWWDRRDMEPERFLLYPPARTPSALCLSRPTAPARAPTPTRNPPCAPIRFTLGLPPHARRASPFGLALPPRRVMGAVLSVSAPRGTTLSSRLFGKTSWVLCAGSFSIQAVRGVREIRSGCAAQRVGGAERPGPAREHVRRERISRTSRGPNYEIPGHPAAPRSQNARLWF